MRKLSTLVLSIALLIGCLGLGAHAAESPAVTRVVSTYYGEGAQGFHWYTTEDCASQVIIGGKTYTGTSAKFKGSYTHSVVAEGLAPGMVYTYQIGDCTGTFKTDPGRGKPFNCIITGDIQASDEAGFAYSAATLNAAWDKFPTADFYVTLGDFTNECDDARWAQYFDAFKVINQKAALVPIAGNHDGMGKWNWFRNMFTLKEPNNPLSNLTGVYYSFDYGDAHFAVLNTNDMYPMSVPQRNWLVNDMSRSNAKWKIVFMHKSPYSAGSDANSPDVLLLRRALLPLFDDLGIDFVMYGHDHQYYRSVPAKGDKPAGAASQDGTKYVDPKGTVYILPGAACGKRYAIHDSGLASIRECAAKHEEPGKPIFTNLAINGDTLTYEAYTYDSGTKTAAPYDTLTLQKTTFSKPDSNFKPLPTDYITTFPQHLWNFVSELFSVIVFDYIGSGLLWDLVGALLG